MTPEIDATLESYRGVIAQTQALYLATHNVYAQGLETHTTPPTVGTMTAPDRLNTSPSDQPDSWKALIPVALPPAWQFSVRIDVYSESGTAGYVIVASVLDANGDRYERAIDEGPEGRSHDWEAVE